MKKPKYFDVFEKHYMFDEQIASKKQQEVIKKYAIPLTLVYLCLISLFLIFLSKLTFIFLVISIISIPFIMDYFIKKNNDEYWFKNVSRFWYIFMVFQDYEINRIMSEIEFKKEFNELKVKVFKDLKKSDLAYALEYCNHTKNENDLKIYNKLKRYYERYSEELRLNKFNEKIKREESSIGVKLKNKLLLKIENS